MFRNNRIFIDAEEARVHMFCSKGQFTPVRLACAASAYQELLKAEMGNLGMRELLELVPAGWSEAQLERAVDDLVLTERAFLEILDMGRVVIRLAEPPIFDDLAELLEWDGPDEPESIDNQQILSVN